jgi:hypothetical protein
VANYTKIKKFQPCSLYKNTIKKPGKLEKFLLTNGGLYCIIHSVRGVKRAPPKEKEIIK